MSPASPLARPLFAALAVSALAGTTAAQCTINFSPATLYTVNGDTRAIDAGDLNGDSRPDLVTGSAFSSQISVLINAGDGTFLPRVTYPFGGDGRGIVVADFDNDGIRDVVVANGGNAGPSGVSFFHGNGDGTLAAALFSAGGNGPRSLVAGHFDSDGRLDIAMGNLSSSTITRMLGQPGGSFGAAMNIPSISTPTNLAVGKLNDTHGPDLVVTGGSSSLLSYVCMPDGSFTGNGSYPTGGGGGFPISTPAIADLNGDGWGDAVTPIFSSPGLSVLLGTGGGPLSPGVVYPTPSSAHSVAIADIDGDGRPDVVASLSPGEVAVHRGVGDGTLASPVLFTVPNDARNLVVADFSGDGRPDIAVATTGGGSSVALLINVTAAPLAITGQPTHTSVLAGQSASLSVTATGVDLTYQWRRDGVALVNGGRISGAQLATLQISPAIASDFGVYDVSVTGGCFGNTIQSMPAALHVLACYANCDGSTLDPVLNVADFTCFLQRYVSGCAAP
jgi:hypothetical protein